MILEPDWKTAFMRLAIFVVSAYVHQNLGSEFGGREEIAKAYRFVKQVTEAPMLEIDNLTSDRSADA